MLSACWRPYDRLCSLRRETQLSSLQVDLTGPCGTMPYQVTFTKPLNSKPQMRHALNRSLQDVTPIACQGPVDPSSRFAGVGPVLQLQHHRMFGFVRPQLSNSGWLCKLLKDCYTTVVYTDSCQCFPLYAALFCFPVFFLSHRFQSNYSISLCHLRAPCFIFPSEY